MENLIIRINNGQAEGHPIILDNFIQAFPSIDINNLPEEFKLFKRVSCPEIGTYQILDPLYPVYEIQDDIVTDVWKIREMTGPEKQSKINAAMADIHPNGYIFDEEICGWVAPIPYPDDGVRYIWGEDTLRWEVWEE